MEGFLNILAIITSIFIIFIIFFPNNYKKLEKRINSFCKKNNINNIYKNEMYKYVNAENIKFFLKKDCFELYNYMFKDFLFDKCQVYNDIIHYYELDVPERNSNYFKDLYTIYSKDKSQIIQKTFIELYSILSNYSLYQKFKEKDLSNKSIVLNKFKILNKGEEIPKEIYEISNLFETFFKLTDKLINKNDNLLTSNRIVFLDKVNGLINIIN